MKKEYNQLWIEKNEEGYTIGLTPELQDDLGDVNFADIAELGSIQAGDVLAEVEASKTIVALTAPLSGTIIRRNEKTEDDPSILNSADAKKHWLVVMKDVSETAWEQLG
ncbi:glycine cleavage system protein H [Enterococcus saccharolyticus]|uniref:glycine cleavage system protein H n=1 Tax=Enterococcus saccharolyticus TaxID=41997 RepID=UPI001E4F83DB|nr:glycine cleavage system protein H [Enterococcus saccharolyticus]MCD5002681.1 glycine cleavage system protein H [Enterococcus saccharolyticus]